VIVPVHLWAQPRVDWVDPSPHTVRLVEVEPGTRVEVLDWGGPGRTLVLLTQLGQTAHLYDYWAPKLARSYRVLGITRRGYGDSAMPSDEDLDRLARAFVDMAKGPPDSRRLYVSFSAAQQFGKKRGIRDPEGARRQLTALLLHARPTSSPAVWRVRRDGQDVTARIARDEEGGTDLLVVVAANVRDL